ncbi:OmpA/MotB family protein [Botrimarina hoheduenensis]|uniref:Motility protein B n=1 Tax=Botrimarina hoheduenensis TaxID=2528000 RepID=A0A5C5VZJ1_9BACT|nr:flagellar motor protein MotB [Botrimarina hoheduenensis]TWT43191.1 Motility protein B [Botrimarina hoheduenensis]
MDDDEGGGGDIPEWIVTFGDMMSLLLTFFIMLVSMSEIKEEEQYQAMLASMRRQFGHEASLASMIPGQSPPMNSSMQSIASMGRAKRKDIVRGGNKVKSVTGEDNLVRTIRPGQDTTVGGVIFFDEDSAELDSEARDRLQEIAAQVAGKPQKIEIRGHSTRKPTDGFDHWSLAYQRCRVTLDFLVEAGIEPKRIRLGSAGMYEPLDKRTAESSRKRNARVEVLMWDEPVDLTN